MAYDINCIQQIYKIAQNHAHWLKEDCEGWENMRAYMDYMNFSYANFGSLSLPKSSFFRSNFERANLDRVDLHESYLAESSFSNANLVRANLSHANLRGADFSYADLGYADLSYVYAEGANFTGARLTGANLMGVDVDTLIPQCCPSHGEFIAWKKAVRYFPWSIDEVYVAIVKLMIPEDARRSSATGRKCRASKAVCLAIEDLDGSPSPYHLVHSTYDVRFVYEVGKTYTVDNFCEDRFKECAPGIHFFMIRQEAVNY